MFLWLSAGEGRSQVTNVRHLARRSAGGVVQGIVSVLWLVVAPVHAQTDTSVQDAIGWGDVGDSGTPPTDPLSEDALGFSESSLGGTEGSSGSTMCCAMETGSSSLRFGLGVGWQSALRITASEPSQIAKLRQVLSAYAVYAWSVGRVQLSARLAGRTEVDFEYLRHDALYDAASYEQYAWQLRSGESYVGASVSGFELRFGQQLVSFGEGELLSVLNRVNPLDLREPLMADLSALRLPVLMTHASLSSATLRVELVVVHEANFGLRAPPLGAFSPMRKLLLESPGFGSALEGRELRYVNVPKQWSMNAAATQAHGRVTWTGPGLDISLMAGTLLDIEGAASLPPPSSFDSQDVDLPVHHPRYASIGHSGAWSVGAFVVRWEAAFDIARPLVARETDTKSLSLFTQRRHQLQGMLGLLYAPSTTTSAAVEVAQSYVVDNPARDPVERANPLFPVEAPRFALRISQNLLRERCSFNLIVLGIGALPMNAWAARAEFGYKLRDGLEATLGVVTLQPTSRFGPFYGLDHQERMYLNLRWDVMD